MVVTRAMAACVCYQYYNNTILLKQLSKKSPSMSFMPTRIRLCDAADIANGSTLKVEHGDLVLAIFNVGGNFFVTDDSCTHGPGSLSEGYLEDDIIECNFHGGQFNVRTGEVVGPPCMVPVKTYKVIVEDGNVFIEI
jgi:nitrite reductase/ring-hydroxylating ferredoxin subunit